MGNFDFQLFLPPVPVGTAPDPLDWIKQREAQIGFWWAPVCERRRLAGGDVPRAGWEFFGEATRGPRKLARPPCIFSFELVILGNLARSSPAYCKNWPEGMMFMAA